MPEDDKRYELIDGQIYMTPSPSIRHQEVSGDIFVQLRAGAPDGQKVFYAPTDFDLVADQRVKGTRLVRRAGVEPEPQACRLAGATGGRDHIAKYAWGTIT